ncbi:DUF4258 domain-containing protein [Grimontia sp. SpTr1]|uniref:DUF4258 domain-containing protein n=1 Tax=Grimontia sp. SpTr1 TaxID=2995319 RepID=UPI00248B4086|nr:DUF4258 domain-containing protein [Grimontia sp. SpTr1]
MDKSTPITFAEFPLTAQSAKKVIRDLAENHTRRIKFGGHSKQRQNQRSISTRDVMTVIKSRSSVITEGPYQRPNGSWRFNLEGMASGSRIRVVIDLRRHEDDPSAFIVTVINTR